jgi:hypothetical protein
MQARLKIGEVLLTAGIGGVFVQFLLGIVAVNVPLGDHIRETEE